MAYCKHKALVLGANYYIGLSAIRCLGRLGVHVTAADYDRKRAFACSSRYCRERLLLPHYSKAEQFVAALADYGRRQQHKPLLLPTADAYAEVLDRYCDQLKEYYLLPNPRPNYYSEIMDKKRLHSLASRHQLAVPETLAPHQADRAERELGFPCLVKPQDSPEFVKAFRVKMFVVGDRRELDQVLERCSRRGIDVLIQQIVPGFDDCMHTYDAYVDQAGRVTHWLTCRKQRQYPINYGASVYTRQEYVPRLHDIGAPFLEAIGYRGFGEIEFKFDQERDRYYLIEVNVRLSNLNVLLERAGLNFPWIMYRDLTGRPLPPKAVTRNTGLHFWFAREDLFALRDYIKAGQMGVGSALGSLLRRKVPAIWEWRDPVPSAAYAGLMARRLWQKLRRRKAE